MDLKQLRRFATLADEGSFARASEVLSISQPSVSRSIQLLEGSLGVRLFDRVGQGVVLTSFGRALLPYARSILNDRASAIEAIATTRKEQDKAVRLAITPRSSGPMARALIGALNRDYPELSLHLAEGTFPSLLNQLREGTVDLAYGSRDSYLDLAGLDFEPVCTASAGYAVRSQHPLAGQATWSDEDLLRYRWAIPDEPAVMQSWRRIFEMRRLPMPTVAVHGGSAQIVYQSVLAADLIGMFDTRDLAEPIAAGLVSVNPSRNTMVWDVGIFRRANVPLSKEQTKLADTLRKMGAGT